MEIEDEEWKNIDGFSDYEVSNLGRIRSSKSGIPKFLSPMKDKCGYLTIKLINDQKIRKSLFVHRLISSAFIENPKPEEYKLVDHINGIKHDNRIENLQWCNSSINAKKAVRGLSGSRAIILKKDGIVLSFTSVTKASIFLKSPRTSVGTAVREKNIFKGYTIEYKDEIKKHIPEDDEIFIDLEYKENIGIYEISNKGTIINKETGRILKFYLSGGYPAVNLYKKRNLL